MSKSIVAALAVAGVEQMASPLYLVNLSKQSQTVRLGSSFPDEYRLAEAPSAVPVVVLRVDYCCLLEKLNGRIAGLADDAPRFLGCIPPRL
jgi:hypothetical protein